MVDKPGQMTEQIVIDSDDEEVPINDASNENKEEGDSIEGNEVQVIAKTEYDHKQGHVQGRAPTGGRGHSGVDSQESIKTKEYLAHTICINMTINGFQKKGSKLKNGFLFSAHG